MTLKFLASLTPAFGKAVKAAARLRGGGTAFPGKVVEQVDKDFLARTLAQLPYGVILVSGTNGKTTTTRIIASILSNLGLRVFTNPTGSNFTRGVVSALIDRVDMSGKIDADIAVLELDEAYAVHFVKQVKPRYSLLLNVMRDQLDRFGEIDTTARMLAHAAEATSGIVILNREDPRIAALLSKVNTEEGASIRYFGLADNLTRFFPTDDTMHADDSAGNLPLSHFEPADVTLTAVDGHTATFRMDGEDITTQLKLEGVYNLFNAAAALSVVRSVVADNNLTFSNQQMVNALSSVTPAFGRGETIMVNGTPVELILVKNPMGFRLSLQSFEADGHKTMIVINDQYADGRDMSWLWDVDFASLQKTGVAMVSGVRATDMALRLAYDEVPVGVVNDDIEAAVKEFVASNPNIPKHIYCTYTSMLKVRSVMSELAEVEDVGL